MSGDHILPVVWQRRLLTVALAGLVLYLLHLLSAILMPFLLAWIAAYLANPLVDILERRFKCSRDRAVIAVFGLCGAVLLLLALLIIPVIVNETTYLVSQAPTYESSLRELFERYQAEGRIPPEATRVMEEAVSKLREQAPAIASWVGGVLFSWLGSLVAFVGFFFDALIFVFVLYYFLFDFHRISENLIKAVPNRHREGMRGLVIEIDRNLKTVLRGQFLVALALVGLYAIGLTIAGVPYAILIGLVAGFGNFLPYIGPMLGLCPAFLFVALHAGFNLDALLYPFGGILVVFGIVQFLEGFVLTPRLAGSSVGLGPVAVLFALSACGALFGLFGVVAALPLAAIVKVLLARGWSVYTSSDFYRRERA